MTLDVKMVRIMRDNYAWLLRDAASGMVGVVDPGEAPPVIREIDAQDGRLDWIWNTHHHADHTGGNEALRQRYGAKVCIGEADGRHLKHVDVRLRDGEEFALGESVCRVIHLPGHTRGHVVFWFKGDKMLFSGDVLFSMTCGNIFEGTDEQMMKSLERLYALPDDTMLYCGHEYTNMYIDFAVRLDPHNPQLQEKLRQVRQLKAEGKASIPVPLGDEKRLNPWLRVFDPGFARTLGCRETDAFALFREVTRRDT